ncbi:hypothetical protein H5410_058852 [Solanum commersonii]|uniref:Uncharacterized protein n=1 Tax=Solanum commersonii TaxID=4109 RepID=A0A9J5W1Q0_SOLCO|nr:hypothetical protein H5410_058852 [Solanum commersonii]
MVYINTYINSVSVKTRGWRGTPTGLNRSAPALSYSQKGQAFGDERVGIGCYWNQSFQQVGCN